MKYCVINRNFDDFFERVVKVKAKDARERISIGYFLKTFGIKGINLKDFDLDESRELNELVLEDLKKCLLFNWQYICQIYEQGRQSICKMLLAEIGEAKKIGFVDASSNGNGLLNLKYLVEELTDKAVHVDIFMSDRKYSEAGGFVYDEDVNCYMFSENMNIDCYETMFLQGRKGINLRFEFLTQAPHARFSGIDDEGDFLFDPPENENYEITEKISEGIADFCNEFVKTFKKDKYLYENITGSEAFRSFESAVKVGYKGMVDRQFKDVVVERHLIGSNIKTTYADFFR